MNSSLLWSLPSSAGMRVTYQGWAVSLVTPPTAEPISIVQAKLQTRVENDLEDQWFIDSIAAARIYCERICFSAFITQVWDFWLPVWPATNRIRLPYAPLQSVTTFEYTDLTETTTAVDPTTYVVRNGPTPGEIVLKFAQIWPPVVLSPGWPIHIRMTAGYGPDSTTVPGPICHAIKMLVGHWYENRESVIVGRAAGTSTNVGMAVDMLLGPYRMSQAGFQQVRMPDPLAAL
jgi:uncharacterized phiE125 gp8 family phage protein